ncbi:MAG: phosphatase PAP2 family protein [Bacteroidales bacterium]|nr:phosphatase PAP2 family protein [Bacteroidales bacterium]
MKKAVLALLAALLCLGAAAQTGAREGSFDYDMRSLRNALDPQFSYDYGNWIQYFSGAAVWGLKACGVPSRYDWGQMAVAHAGGAVASLILDHGPKWVIDRMRPDGSRANSFPSGHTTTAFLTATWLQKEYGDSLPWLCGIGYGMATLTAQQRILRNKHWTTDTMAGAVLGVAAAELGYWLSDIILGRHSYRFFDEFSYDTSLKYWDVTYWYSRRLAFDGRHGASASMQVQAPLGAHWGLAMRGAASNIDDTRAILSTLGGAYYVHQAAPKAEIGAHVLAGAGWWNNGQDFSGAGSDIDGMTYAWRADGCGFDFVAGLSAAYVLTQSAKIRVIAEWEAFPAAGWLNSINLGLGGSIYF